MLFPDSPGPSHSNEEETKSKNSLPNNKSLISRLSCALALVSSLSMAVLRERSSAEPREVEQPISICKNTSQ